MKPGYASLPQERQRGGGKEPARKPANTSCVCVLIVVYVCCCCFLFREASQCQIGDTRERQAGGPHAGGGDGTSIFGVAETERLSRAVNLPTKILDFGGFDSSITFILRGGILMSIGNSPESLSQGILIGIILVGRLGVHEGGEAVLKQPAGFEQRRIRTMLQSDPGSFLLFVLFVYIYFLPISNIVESDPRICSESAKRLHSEPLAGSTPEDPASLAIGRAARGGEDAGGSCVCPFSVFLL